MKSKKPTTKPNGVNGHKPPKERTLPGAHSMFRGKVRAPMSITLIPEHHAKVKANVKRLTCSRNDFFGLLIEKFADTVKP